VLYVSFAHESTDRDGDRLRLATCSKDRTIRVWALAAEQGRDGAKHARRKSGSGRDGEDGGDEHKQRQTNGSINGFASGSASSSGTASATPRSAAGALELVCTGVMRAPASASASASSRPSTPSPSSSASGSPRSGDTSAPYLSVHWSPDNTHLLACNGVDVSVFRVADGKCVLTVGATAVVVDAEAQAARPATASGSGAGSRASSAASASASASASSSAPASAPASTPAPAAPDASLSVPLLARHPGGYSMLHSGSFSSPGAAAAAAAAPAPAAPAPAASAAASAPLIAISPSALAHNLAQLLSSPLLASLGIRGSALAEHLAPGSGGGASAAAAAAAAAAAVVAEGAADRDGIVGHLEPVTCCAWVGCEDGLTFVTGSCDRRLLLWSLDGALLDVWAGEMVGDMAVAGDRLLAATPHNTCILFRIRENRIEEV
jgi:hypothetical protein